MSLPLIFSPDARAELDEAAAWYESQRPGLGHRLLARVYAVTELVETWPQLHPVVHRDLRRGLVHGFPYAVIYRVESDHVVVVALADSRRDPRIWQRR